MTVREELRDLARRRQRAIADEASVAADIRIAVKKARAEGIPLTEVATLLGLDRSSMYRTYVETDTPHPH